MTKRIDRRDFVASTLATAAAATVGTMTTLVPMQAAQAAVAVDHSAVQVVQVACGEVAAVQKHQWTKIWRNHRNAVENHPLGTIRRTAKT